IRDRTVTGVQTCALPISTRVVEVARGRATSYRLAPAAAETRLRLSALLTGASADRDVTLQRLRVAPGLAIAALSAEPVAEYGPKIGRASCRERVKIGVVR